MQKVYFRKVIFNVDPILNVLNALKIQIVSISITRDMVSHIRGRYDCTFDVICLSEAHLCMDKTYLDSDRFHINNYSLYKTFSTIKYDGCVVYVRDTYNANKVLSLCGSNSISDYLYVNISIPGSIKPLCVGVYYRHNKHDKNTLHKFIDQLDTQLYSTDIRNKLVIIMGDMNIDLTKLSASNDIEL